MFIVFILVGLFNLGCAVWNSAIAIHAVNNDLPVPMFNTFMIPVSIGCAVWMFLCAADE